MTSKFTDVIEYLNTSVKNISLFLFRMSYEFCWIFRNCSHNVTYVSALDILFCKEKLMDNILRNVKGKSNCRNKQFLESNKTVSKKCVKTFET